MSLSHSFRPLPWMATIILFSQPTWGTPRPSQGPTLSSRLFTTAFVLIIIFLALFPAIFTAFYCYWKKRARKREDKIGTDIPPEEYDLTTGPRDEYDDSVRRIERPHPSDAPPPYAYPLH